jgi:uncharacterized protein (TIGR03435 family)
MFCGQYSMKIQTDIKTLPVYELVVAKGRPKLKNRPSRRWTLRTMIHSESEI